MEIRREFICRVPATLVKDPALLPLAKLLYLVLASHADGHTGRAYLSLARLDNLLGCGRGLREKAQRQLVAHGWLRLERKPTGRGRWGSRVFVLNSAASATSARFDRSGENEPFFNTHSQVSPSAPTSSD
jgi:hypothetical protein